MTDDLFEPLTDLMLAWFANAIETGRMAGAEASTPSPETLALVEAVEAYRTSSITALELFIVLDAWLAKAEAASAGRTE